MTNAMDRLASASEAFRIMNESWRLGELASSDKMEESAEGQMLLDAGLTDEEKSLAKYWFSCGFKLKEKANA